MFLFAGGQPLRAEQNSDAAEAGGGNLPDTDRLWEQVSNCQLDLDSIRTYILPALKSSDIELVQEAAFRLHGSFEVGSQSLTPGIDLETSRAILPELEKFLLENPFNGACTFLSHVVARAQNEDACQVLIKLFELQISTQDQDESGLITTFTFGALAALGEHAAAAIPVLEKYRGNNEFDLDEDLKHALCTIYSRVRIANTQQFGAYDGPGYLNLPQELHTIPSPRLPLTAMPQLGKLIDEQLQFCLNGPNSACRVRAFRCSPDTVLVFFTADQNSYGTTITNAVDLLATCAVRKFGLDLSETRFVEHYDVSYGMDPDPHLWLISRLEANATGTLHSPDWMNFETIEEAFEALKTIGFRPEWLNDSPAK
jgi:hypothetical protein